MQARKEEREATSVRRSLESELEDVQVNTELLSLFLRKEV